MMPHDFKNVCTSLNNDARFVTTLSGVIGFAMGILIILTIHSCHPQTVQASSEPTVVIVNQCHKCHSSKASMVAYFAKIGSPKPLEVTNALLKTKHPAVLSAMAKVESCGNPDLRHTGYRRLHHGAWQVNPKIHGKVSKRVADQALQADMILSGLLIETNGDLKKALSRYGGDTSRDQKYAKLVLRELREVGK